MLSLSWLWQRRAIISSKMFLKDKYLASGASDKFKARLVAGGHLQDKTLYENLSSPTTALTSVFTTATIAAREGRQRVIIDIGRGGGISECRYGTNRGACRVGQLQQHLHRALPR